MKFSENYIQYFFNQYFQFNDCTLIVRESYLCDTFAIEMQTLYVIICSKSKNHEKNICLPLRDHEMNTTLKCKTQLAHVKFIMSNSRIGRIRLIFL